MSKKGAFMSVVERRLSLRSTAKSTTILNHIVTNRYEDLLSITYIFNIDLKKTNLILMNKNKQQKKKMMDQKKQLWSKNVEINSLKKELNRMKLDVAKKDNEIKENEELLETERNINTKLQERIHNERKDRKQHNDISRLNNKLKSDISRILNHVKAVEEENIKTKKNNCHLLDQITKKDNVIKEINKNIKLIHRSNETLIKKKD